MKSHIGGWQEPSPKSGKGFVAWCNKRFETLVVMATLAVMEVGCLIACLTAEQGSLAQGVFAVLEATFAVVILSNLFLIVLGGKSLVAWPPAFVALGAFVAQLFVGDNSFAYYTLLCITFAFTGTFVFYMITIMVRRTCLRQTQGGVL